MPLPDALRDALGQVVADLRRDWRREQDVSAAETRALVAEQRAVIAELREQNAALQAEAREQRAAFLADLDQRVAARLAELRDGVDGAPGCDGTDGRDGRDAEPPTEEALQALVARHIEANPPAAGRDGLDGAPGPAGPAGADAPPVTDEQIAALVAGYLAANPPPAGPQGPAGADGADAAPVADERLAAEVARYLAANPPPAGPVGPAGADGRDGDRGERGEPGPAGRLPLATAWRDAVHYAGDVVTHHTGTWQAVRDTGREPGHEDWVCLAPAGRDGAEGRSLRVRSTWDAAEEYRALDVVALNGGAFVARRDAPGPCPGEGWQLLASRGKPGPAGERGAPGAPAPIAGVVAADVDAEGRVTLTNADGSTVSADLYPVLSRIAHR